jgi:hypothetical protein
MLFLHFRATMQPFKWKSTGPNKKYCVFLQKIQHPPYLLVEIVLLTCNLKCIGEMGLGKGGGIRSGVTAAIDSDKKGE